MKNLHAEIPRTDIGPTLAEIDSALLTQCMHITTTSRNDMRKVLTNFVAARHAAAELVVAVPEQQPFLYQNPMHPEQVSFRRVPNWRELFTRPQPAVKEAAELSKAELLAMWRGANRIAYVEDDGEAHEFFYRAVLAAQKAKS